MTLAALPKDVMEATLTKYCDGHTLVQFWTAVVGCKETWNTVEEDGSRREESVRDYFNELL